jgi:hypothetical protein
MRNRILQSVKAGTLQTTYARLPGTRADRYSDLLLLAVLAAITVAGTVIYVATERGFYSWDYAYYEEVAFWTADVFRDSPFRALRTVAGSMSDDYNLAFTVPLLPVLLLGRSRLVYELALALLYFLPFALAVGAIASRAVPPHSRGVFWSAVGITLLTPMAWVPMLRGLPDTGGAMLMCLALWLYLRDPQLKRAHSFILIALPLVAAVLFRRHFGYAVVAFFVAAALVMVIHAGEQARAGGTSLLRGLSKSLARLVLLGIVALVVLLVVGCPLYVWSWRGTTTRSTNRTSSIPWWSLQPTLIHTAGLCFSPQRRATLLPALVGRFRSTAHSWRCLERSPCCCG